MNTETNEIEGISNELLRRYVKMRHRIDTESNNIFSITSILSLLETCGDDKIEVDPIALAKISHILNKNILNIWEILDDFIYIVQAQSVLEEIEK